MKFTNIREMSFADRLSYLGTFAIVGAFDKKELYWRPAVVKEVSETSLIVPEADNLVGEFIFVFLGKTRTDVIESVIRFNDEVLEECRTEEGFFSVDKVRKTYASDIPYDANRVWIVSR